MYVHPAFKTHHATSLAFAAARGFGMVIACDGGRPVASPLPFRIVEADGKAPRVELHVARVNPLAALAEKGGTWLVSVQGNDAYVSPDWYASAEQVPTWLYETVQLSGPAYVIPEPHMGAHLDDLTAQFEGWLAPKPPWTAARLSDTRRAMMMKAIVAIGITVETVEGSFKLNQHKPDADNAALADALARQNDPAARAIAARMVALRPDLDYQHAVTRADIAEGTSP